jgi:hypothetical protein
MKNHHLLHPVVCNCLPECITKSLTAKLTEYSNMPEWNNCSPYQVIFLGDHEPHHNTCLQCPLLVYILVYNTLYLSIIPSNRLQYPLLVCITLYSSTMPLTIYSTFCSIISPSVLSFHPLFYYSTLYSIILHSVLSFHLLFYYFTLYSIILHSQKQAPFLPFMYIFLYIPLPIELALAFLKS